MGLAASRKTLFFDWLRAVQGCAAIFDGNSHRKWEPFENRVARQDVSMPRSAGMRESGVRMAMLKKPWTAFSADC
jgi:hypothetical protein